jgi:hypothetical protein
VWKELTVRVDIIFRPNQSNPQLRGSVRLGEDGKVTFDPQVADIEELVVVLEPGNPDHRLTPEDGEAYLRALPSEFRSGYVSAVLIED